MVSDKDTTAPSLLFIWGVVGDNYRQLVSISCYNPQNGMLAVGETKYMSGKAMGCVIVVRMEGADGIRLRLLTSVNSFQFYP